ncbi:diacylglycerol kinase family protein [Salinibacterium sp.]|uniref:diacylglycerol/lipid kinase family protein n=1 Tax=Salinibacterium sp. TaxID=1915057 RepID=UPI002869FBCA|nr:diacylglycerol kinase family protein [Salinibacterium sp.]
MVKNTAAFIYNPIKVDLDALKAAVAAEPFAAGWKVLWLPTSKEDAGQGPAKQAIDTGADLIITAGGDGTVRAVAEVVRGTGTTMALLPSGTGNLLARNLSLTLDDTADSLATAFGGTTRDIDVAGIEIRRADRSTDSHVFLVMAGTGLDAKIMSNTDSELKKRVGWLAYAHALFVVLRDKNTLRLNYKVDADRTRSARVQAIIIGNCGSLPANILLLPDAVVDDGLLDVIVVKPESFRGWLEVMVKIFWENGIVGRLRWGRRARGLKTDSVDFRQAKTLVIKLNRAEEVQLDGDPFGEMVACRITVDPGALTIKVPQG